MKTHFLQRNFCRGLSQWLLLTAALFHAQVTPLRADGPVPPPLLEFTSGLPGKQVKLSWLAEVGVRYRIEKSSNLETGGADGWKQVALVEATNTQGVWLDPVPTTTKAFYRVVQPVPEVFAIYPPLLSTNGGVLSLQSQAIPVGSFLVLNVNGQLVSVPLNLVAGVWQATVSGPLNESASVIAVGITHNGETIVSLNSPITVTTTGLAADAPPTLPPGAPLEMDSVKPISGIGIVVKSNPYATSGERAARPKRFPPSLFAHNIMQRFQCSVYDTSSFGSSTSGKAIRGKVKDVKHDSGTMRTSGGRVFDDTNAPLDSVTHRKGYQYYMSKSDRDSAQDANNPLYHSPSNSGQNPLHETHRSSGKRSEAELNLGALKRSAPGLPGEVHIPVSALSLACPAGPNIDFACTYRSMVPVSSDLGQGWDFSYNIFIEILSADRVAVHDGQGRRDIFHRQPDNSFRCDGMFREGHFDGETFTLAFADTGKWVFRPMDSSVAPGKIATITDRNDVSLTCNYDGTGKLSSVSSQFGQSITVAYTGDRISGITDHTGRTVAFSYYGPSNPSGSEGDLQSISCPQDAGQPPAAGPVTFTYSTGSLNPRLNGNLLSATDGAGRTLGIFTYSAETNPLHIDFDTCASAQRYKTGHVSLIKRVIRPDGGYTMIEVDEVGRVTETDLDRLHRLIVCRQYTGFSTPNVPVTSSSNRPTGKLRATDPDYFETTYSYNADSLCTQITHPDGSQEITTYDRDFRKNCPVLEKGNPRLMTLRTPGGEQRTVSCDYLPGFGSLEFTAPKVNPKHIKNWEGKDRTIAPDGGITAMDDWQSPVVRMVSAHGQVTTYDYDSNGNLISVTSPVPGRGSLYQYNTLGQLTSRTTLNGSAPSFVDACNYDVATKFLSSFVSDSGGLNLTTAFYRDTRGRIIRSVDPRGNDELCSYNALDQILEIKSPLVPQRIATTFHYDAGACLARCDTEHRDAAGVLVPTNPAYSSFFVYNDHGLLIQTAEEERPVDGSGLLIPASLGIANFAVCDVSLNNAGECVRLSTPAVCRDQAEALVCDFSYDERGFLHLTHEGGEGNPDGLVTARDYNLYGAIPQSWTVRGQGTTTVESRTYDGFHRLSTETDPMGNVCLYEYDNQGYVTCSVFGEVNDVPGSTNNELLAKKKYQVGQPIYGNISEIERVGMKPEKVTFGGGSTCASSRYYTAKTGKDSVKRIVAPVNNHAINTKGAGGINRIVAPVSSMAINTKGAGGINRTINPFFGFETEDETITCDRFTPGGAITPEVTTIDLSPAGLVQHISRNGDVLETCSYDSAGRLIGHVCGDTSHFFTLNPNGDLVSSTRTDTCPSDAAQTKTFTINNVFDAAGRITQTTDGTGNVSSCAYDSLHRPVSFTKPGGLVTKFAYDSSSAGVPFSQEISADAVTPGTFVMLSRSLVRSGELRSTTDSYGHTTTNSNDALGRMTRCDYADGTFKTHGHVHINIGTIGHVDHGKTTLTHNLNGQLTSSLTTSDPLIAPVSSTPLKTFTHDGLGRMTSASQGTHVVACAYDSLGNLVSESQDSRVVSSTFDHRGRTGITYPDGRSFVEARDGIGRLVSISALNAGVPVVPPVVSNEYAGYRVFRSTQGNGVVTTFQYRGDGEASLPGAADFTFDACVKSNINDLSITTFHRDRNQRLIRDATAFSTAATPPIRVKAIGRNRLGDLTLCTTRRRAAPSASLVLESEITYTRDLEGRRLSATGGANPGSYEQLTTLPPGDQQMGQYSTWPLGPLAWDDNGNLISMATANGILSFVHDVEGRLTSASRDGVPVISYDYDPLGRCISRDPEVGPATTFVYDGDVCLQELGEDSLPDLTHVYADGIHQSISSRNGSTFYPHASGRSRDKGQTWEFYPRANSNCITGPTGAVVERFDCDDSGKPLFLTIDYAPSNASSSSTGLRWLTPGCAWEPEIEMYQCPSGFHSPVLDMSVSHQKIKPIPKKSGHNYVGHVSLIR